MKKCLCLLIPTSLLLVSLLFLLGCGKIAGPDKIVLRYQALGNRTVDTANQQKGFMSECFTGIRLYKVGGKEYVVFPRGLIAYRFTKEKSIESAENEEFVIAIKGGTIRFNGIIHMMIDTSYSDLPDRLDFLVRQFGLKQFINQENPLQLSAFMKKKLRPIMEESFARAMGQYDPMSVIGQKESINKAVFDDLNKQLNQYALRVTLAGIASSFTPGSADQQNTMNSSFESDMNRQITEKVNAEVLPIDRRIKDLENSSDEAVRNIENRANETAAAIVSSAWVNRGEKISSVVGKERYVQFEEKLSSLIAYEIAEKADITIIDGQGNIIGPNGEISTFRR